MINGKKIMDKAKSMQISQKELATELDLAQPTLSQKLNNKRPMMINEAFKLQNILGIPDNEFGAYFFN